MRLVAPIVVLLVCAYCSGSQPVVFQAFDWNSLSNKAALYQNIASMAPSLASSGITDVWFPPPSQSADAQGYMPGQWYQIVSQSQWQSALSSVQKQGMNAICDIVINHRTATYKHPCNNNWINFTNPDWDSWSVVRNDYECNSGDSFCSNGCNCGNADTGQNFCGAPDVDHTNPAMQTDIINWLQWLQSSFGFTGWRFDMVIGYGGQYCGMYVNATKPHFSVGEYWDDNVSNVINWIKATGYQSHAFDFPLRDTLKGAIDSNSFGSLISGVNPPGVMGQMPQFAATFTDNHDTARNDRFGNTDQIIQGYAYLLTHPGTPFVFYDDWNTPEIQAAIKTLIAIRNNHGLSETEHIYIDQHKQGVYSAYLGNGANECSGRVAMKLGTDSWQPCGSGWSLATSGNNYAVWTS